MVAGAKRLQPSIKFTLTNYWWNMETTCVEAYDLLGD